MEFSCKYLAKVSLWRWVCLGMCHSRYQCAVLYLNLIHMAQEYTKPASECDPGFLMTQCGSLPPSLWGRCGSVHPRHTDPLCSTFCSGHIQACWPRFTSRPDSLLIRGSLDWSDWESKGWEAVEECPQSFLSHTVCSSPAINNKCSFIVNQLCNALFDRNVNQWRVCVVNQRWVLQWSLN